MGTTIPSCGTEPARLQAVAKLVAEICWEDIICIPDVQDKRVVTRVRNDVEQVILKALVLAYCAGIWRFAWWQDAEMMVGTCGTTYKAAVEKVRLAAGLPLEPGDDALM